MAAVALLGLGTLSGTAIGGDCLKPCPPGPIGEAGSLAELGERALERLPWDVHVIRANLSARRPTAVTACYLMQDDLLVVTQSGIVYCMARRDLTPRWSAMLKAPLDAIPGEGPTEYVFLVKDHQGRHFVHAFSKRTGADGDRFPARLSFAAMGGADADGGRVYVGSLGSPRHNRTLEAISLADGRRSWGYLTKGLLYAAPQLDPSNTSLILACENGHMLSIPVGATAPASANWAFDLGAPISGTPAVSPSRVVVGAQDGTFRGLDLGTGKTMWMHGLDAPIRVSPWILGRKEKVRKSAGVEGAPDLEVDVFNGVAFAKNRKGLFAFDLQAGKALFTDKDGKKPVCQHGQWIVTQDARGQLLFHDAKNGYEVKGRLGLSMFDLLPTNGTDGAIYGCTHDGGLVAAIPKK